MKQSSEKRAITKNMKNREGRESKIAEKMIGLDGWK